MCFGLTFLRVLDALTIRFYTFPIEVLNLAQLRYLALTCNGNVPFSISKLWGLEYFFVRRHLCVNPGEAWPYLPMEIWNTKELRHLQIMGSKLPNPCGAELPHLLTLADMSADSTREILEGTPNLKKLGLQIELPPGVDGPSCCFNDLYHHRKLESLKCNIVNPKPRRSRVSASDLISFGASLKKLNLSGFGYPCNYMSMISLMKNLEVLKLRLYAFRGPEWETKREFKKLRYLLIEETDVVHWVADSCCFPRLECLKVRHCYKLKGIPSIIGGIQLRMIELVDCPSAMGSVKRMQKEYPHMEIFVQSSWEDGKRKS